MHPLASQAGATVLARGGHAVDAAIAVNAVMSVVAPMANGIGGDLFAIVYDAAGTAARHQGSGYSHRPADDSRDARTRHHEHAAEPASDSSQSRERSPRGSRLHERFGRKPLGDLLSSAIDVAKKAFHTRADGGGMEEQRSSPSHQSRSDARLSAEWPPPQVGQVSGIRISRPPIASCRRRT
jgi:gamma-glutamyltranspeptidase/glutathione hydrolase